MRPWRKDQAGLEGLGIPEPASLRTEMFKNLSVTTAKISDLAVTTAKIDSLAVTTAKIDNLAVTTAKIDSLAVTDAKIGTCSITKLTAGNLDVVGTITTNGKFITGASPNPRIEISPTLIAGYSDATTKQFYLSATDGKAYAGAGAVILDATGITIKGSSIIFQDTNGVLRGYLYGITGGSLVLGGGGGDIHLIAGDSNNWVIVFGDSGLKPALDITKDLGSSSLRWMSSYATPILRSTAEELPLVEGALSSSGGADGIMYVYASSAWRINDIGA